MISDEKNVNFPDPAQDENIIRLRKKISILFATLIITILLILALSVCLFVVIKKSKTNQIPNNASSAAVPISEKPKVLNTNEAKAIDTTSQLTGINTSFEAPYPVVWEDTDYTPNFGGSGKFSLTSAYVGNFQITDDILKTLWNGFDNQGYSAGQEINAIVLGFKINVRGGGILPSAVRRIEKDSAGNEDKFPPLNRDYIYEGHKPMNDFVQSDSTIENAKVIFPVPEDKKEFMFSSGGRSEVKFSLTIEDGKIVVKKIENEADASDSVCSKDNSCKFRTPESMFRCDSVGQYNETGKNMCLCDPNCDVVKN